MRRAACVVFFLTIVQTVDAQSISNTAANVVVDNFSISQERTVEVLRALARQAHVVIGVSGELIGPDQKLISVSANQTPLRNVLDDICLKDRRYKWQETKDGNLSVSVGKKRLELLDVIIKTMKIGPMSSPDLMMLVSRRLEVEEWTTHAECRIMQVFTGSAGDTWSLDMNVKSEPLWKVLNDVSLQNGTYFWSALKFSNDPCTINLVPSQVLVGVCKHKWPSLQTSAFPSQINGQ
jgi:hypothetical protein